MKTDRGVFGLLPQAILLAALTLLSCKGEQQPPGVAAPSGSATAPDPSSTASHGAATKPGAKLGRGISEHFITVKDRKRRFLLQLPPGHSAGKKYPLLIFFHGGGGTAAAYTRQELGIAPGAAKANLVAIFAEGFDDRVVKASKRGFTWNSGHCCRLASERGYDDVSYVSALIDHAIAQLDIDPKRVYVMGFSNGGMLTHLVASELSTKIAAAIPIGATVGGQVDDQAPVQLPPKPRAKMPIMIVHGKKDQAVRWEGGRTNATRHSERKTRIDKSAHESAAFWAAPNGCKGAPKKDSYPGWTRETYPCPEDAPVILVSGHELGHKIPRAMGRRTFMDHAVEFLTKHHR